MAANIPPLWRDLDAYNQAIQDPLVGTYWGHGAAYCHFIKLPLWIGEQIEKPTYPRPAGARPESPQPRLTDTGIWLLLGAQHLALALAALSFITAVSTNFWIRLGLTGAWISNSLFYSFAHCVGSETLGLIFVIVVAAQAVRLLLSQSEGRWTSWWIFGGALGGCLLSRHINLCLLGLLPAALILSALLKQKAARANGNITRKFVIAILLGVGVFALANWTVNGLARKTRLHPHSRVGFTFLWRLRFLNDLTPEARRAVLEKLIAETKSPEAGKLLGLLNEMYAQGASFQDWHPFLNRGVEFFGGVPNWERLDGGLNKMAYAFLFPPVPELRQIAMNDFRYALKTPGTDITSYLFDTTAVYYDSKSAMADCARLVTFRNWTASPLTALPLEKTYLKLWRGLPYDKAVLTWAIGIIALFVLGRHRFEDISCLALGVTLVGTGLFMFGASCFLVDDQPRFRLPLWQLLLLSLFLVAGRIADSLIASHRERRSPPGSCSPRAIGAAESRVKVPAD